MAATVFDNAIWRMKDLFYMLKSIVPTKDFEFDQILAKVDETRWGNI